VSVAVVSVVVVVAFLVALFVFWWKPSPVTQTPQEAKSVLIFVDDETYPHLTSELNRLASDVKNDLGVKVSIQHDNYKNAVQVREIIKQYYATKGLLGSILVGDIPYAMVGNPVDGGYTGNFSYPSDAYYQDLDDDWWVDLNKDGMLDARIGLKPPVGHKEVWSGRIKPTMTGEEGITQLRAYLERDHAYRTAPLPRASKALFYNATYRDLIGGRSTLSAFEGWLRNAMQNISEYTSGDSALPFLTSQDTRYISIASPEKEKDEYLSELKNNDYDLVFTNIHGSSELVQIGGRSNITGRDIKQLEPRGRFYIMASCGTARFSDPGYFAGELLFSGRGLGVYGFTEPVGIASSESLVGADYLKNYAPLRLGVIWGEVIKQDATEVAVFLGDPTLALRAFSNSDDLSWEITGPLVHEVKAGESAVVFQLHNKGSAPLVVDGAGVPNSYLSINGKIYNPTPVASSTLYTLVAPIGGVLTPADKDVQSRGIFRPIPGSQMLAGYRILPNEHLDFEFSARGVSHLRTPQDEEVMHVYQTNDPRHPFIELRAIITILP